MEINVLGYEVEPSAIIYCLLLGLALTHNNKSSCTMWAQAPFFSYTKDRNCIRGINLTSFVLNHNK